MSRPENLPERAVRGDHEAFREIFEEHHRSILRYIYAMVGRRDLAEELTQETFMGAYRNIGTLRDEAKLSVWLYGIARNVTLKHFKARKREKYQVDSIDDDRTMLTEPADAAQPPEDSLLNRELNRVVNKALDQLGYDKRTVFTLKVLQLRSYEEIAVITGSSIPKLKTDLHRAKQEMRRMIRPYLEASDAV
jgi:RNA polymerase sigma-70 factor (ECF subfamily)